MGDHFVLLVDRLLTESTLRAAIQSSYQLKEAAPAVVDDIQANCSSEIDTEVGPFPRKIVECRICQDEDVDSNMEAPCSCCGSLKYAHRRCVQRWCTEKGDTICEICHQKFKPDYTAPPPIFHFGAIPVNLRRNWEIARNMSNPRFMAISSDGDFLDVGYDNHEASNSRSLLCFRSLALIFVVLLILRHTLPILVNGARYYSFPLVMLLILRTFGIILPIYVILKAVSAIQRRCHQVPSVTMFDEEVGVSNLQPPTYIVSAQ